MFNVKADQVWQIKQELEESKQTLMDEDSFRNHDDLKGGRKGLRSHRQSSNTHKEGARNLTSSRGDSSLWNHNICEVVSEIDIASVSLWIVKVKPLSSHSEQRPNPLDGWILWFSLTSELGTGEFSVSFIFQFTNL